MTGDSGKFEHTHYSNKFYVPVGVRVFEVLLYIYTTLSSFTCKYQIVVLIFNEADRCVHIQHSIKPSHQSLDMFQDNKVGL